MITLCIMLYVLGAIAVCAIADKIRYDQNTNLHFLIIVAAIWPLVVACGVANGVSRRVYRSLKER